MSTITIAAERPDTPEASMLIAELDAELAPLYARASRHGYSVEQLLAEDVAFFVLRSNGEPAACGGIKLVDGEYAELKRMYVRPRFRGCGYAKRLLAQLAAHAQGRGVSLLRLETGVHQHAAVALYVRFGFVPIAPFGEYRPDPVSLFYEMRLPQPATW